MSLCDRAERAADFDRVFDIAALANLVGLQSENAIEHQRVQNRHVEAPNFGGRVGHRGLHRA